MKHAAVVLFACISACAGEEPVSELVPKVKSIEAVSGGGKIAMYGNTLPDPLIVHAKDQFGRSFPGAVVVFAVTGTVILDRYEVPTNALGNAQVIFSYGLRAGVDTVTATVAGVPGAALFIETANPGVAGTFAVFSGNNQSGAAGAELANDLVVLVTDVAGNPTPAADIVWTAARGSPVFTKNATGLDGKAHLRFTPAAGANVVNVSVDRSALVTTFSATGN